MRNRHSPIHRARRMRFEQLEPRNMLAVFIPGDYDQSGVVDNNDYNEWRANFGQVAGLATSPADGNNDEIIDAADYVVWRKNLGRVAPPNAPLEISATVIGATSIQVSWEAVSAATSYAVLRRQPDTETNFTTIAPSVSTTTYTDNTATADTTYEYKVVAMSANGSSPASKSAEATANKGNLTAYRPQSIQNPANIVDRPIYDRPPEEIGFPGGFPKTAVREADEMSSTLGPGIRANFDWDNGGFNRPDAFESGYEIEMENDLIEVKVDRLPGQGDLVLTVGSRLGLYYNHDKETPVPMTGSTSEPLPFVNDTITVFVEWRSTHGTDTMSLVDSATSTTVDSLRFHSFRSMVVVFGGRNQIPIDTDGDGSIGDSRGGQNREGIFDLAQNMYNSGWDMWAFSATDDNTPAVTFVAETEIINGWDRRFLSPLEDGHGFAILGYSWGGGAAHDLIESLYLQGYPTTFAVYLDAVQHGSYTLDAPERDWPDQTLYLLNIWQPNDNTGPFGLETELGGDSIENPEDRGPATLEEIDLPNENHSSIDDDPFVHQRIQSRINSQMSR